MLQISTEQSTTHEEDRGITFFEKPEGPWKEISIDIIGPLLKSNEKDAIIVIVD